MNSCCTLGGRVGGRALTIAAAAIVLVGCGGSQTGGNFGFPELPPKAELEAVAAQPATPPELERVATPIEQWRLSGPFPATLGPAPLVAGDALDSWLLSQQPGAGGWIATEGMSCAARELARVLATHGGPLDPRLQRYVADTCGVVADHVQLHSWQMTRASVPSTSDLTSSVGPALASIGEGNEVGLAYANESGRAVLAMAWGQTSLAVAPFARTPDANGRVRLSGRFPDEIEQMAAYITVGELEFQECNIHAPLPEFSVDCPMAAEDTTAVIEVMAANPGRLLGHVDLRAMVSRPGADLGAYRVDSLLPAAGVPTTTVSLVDALNTLRARADLAALVLETAQSAFQDQIAPHYFSAALAAETDDDAAAEQDRIALGLMAGWDVQARISSGRFASDWVPAEAGADGWLFDARRSPLSRRALFDPQATRIAVGTVGWDDLNVRGFIVTTYTELAEADPETEALTVLETLSEARIRAGQPGARRLRHERLERIVAEVSAALEAGELEPEQALDRMLYRAGNTVRRNGFGIAIPAQRLDEIVFPEALIDEPQINAIIGVAQVELPGSPWAAHVVLLLHIGGAVNEAALPTTTPSDWAERSDFIRATMGAASR